MRNQSLHIFNLSVVRIFVAALLVLAALPGRVTAQQNNTLASHAPSATSAAVPQIIQFSGQFSSQSSGTSGGTAVPTGTVSITFTLYENEQGGSALWSETQNVQVDAQGHYTALLGSTSPQGLPMNLFTTVQAHWLAVQPLLQGFAEQPRVLLVSAPYALKAGDAETIGGLPPSAFVLATPGTSPSPGTSSVSAPTSPLSGSASSGSQSLSTGQPVPPPLTGTGTKNYIPIWKTGTALGNSKIYQTGGNVGIGTTAPGSALDVNGSINATTYSISGAAVPFLASPDFDFANIALGFFALIANTSGAANTAIGDNALYHNTTGMNNTATGTQALHQNSTGSANTASGYQALFNNNASSNTASGYDALYFNNTGGDNTATGTEALFSNTTGGQNTASGYEALFNNNASNNTASGFNALLSNTTGSDNTANGANALLSNTTATGNTASGYQALFSNTTATGNTASGYQALFSNNTGGDNTASGYQALFFNTTGGDNTASGFNALLSNTTGGGNTANGSQALYNNTIANDNTANGFEALYSDTTGGQNTADGWAALYGNTTGSDNTASGVGAMTFNSTGSQNTAIGYTALGSNTSGNNDIAIGYGAAGDVSGGNSNNIHIGNLGSSGDSGTIRIGTSGTQISFFAAGVSGVNVSGATVLVSSSGQLGVASSSRRYKEDIHDMGDASDGLMRLRPVTFRYKQPFEDGTKPIQYGLIAEEVAEVYPDLVARSADGQIETVKYQVLDPLLLNEVQRQNAEIRDEKVLLLAQQNQIKAQQVQIAELVSNVRTIQPSLRTRRGSGTARVAFAKGHAAPATIDASIPVASSARGGN